MGFMITLRGIEANPDKCEAVIAMRSPQNLKEDKKLTSTLAFLSRLFDLKWPKRKNLSSSC